VTTVVCVHGLGGSPRSLGQLPNVLRRSGFDVVLVTLPGHGGEPSDLVGVTAVDWIDSLRSAVVSANGGDVYLVGQSLGGTLALCLLSDPDMAGSLDKLGGAVVINPPCSPADIDVLEHLDWLMERGKVMHPLGRAYFVDAAAVDDGYPEVPIAALRALAECGALAYEQLPSIKVPVLVVVSAHDDIVDPSFTATLASDLPVGQVLELADSGHVGLLDGESEMLIDVIVSFIESAARG
jgi:carboxylesterase